MAINYVCISVKKEFNQRFRCFELVHHIFYRPRWQNGWSWYFQLRINKRKWEVQVKKCQGDPFLKRVAFTCGKRLTEGSSASLCVRERFHVLLPHFHFRCNNAKDSNIETTCCCKVNTITLFFPNRSVKIGTCRWSILFS